MRFILIEPAILSVSCLRKVLFEQGRGVEVHGIGCFCTVELRQDEN